MAEAAVGSLVVKLGDLIVQEAINLHGVRGQVEWLERELRRMQCFLKDADAKKNKGGIDGERVKNWVTEMRDLAFEAEDIIDTFMYFKLRRQPKKHGFIGFIKRNVFIPVELIGRHKVHVDIEGIKAKMHELSNSRIAYGIDNISQSTSTQDVIPILPQLNDDIAMVGFDDEKINIVQDLVDINNKNRTVISIVGMGGLGKTTLAKSVYNDPAVKRSFDMFAWVIISQEYTILEILKKIWSDVSITSARDTIEGLSVDVYEKLKKSKYLVVLDDVWNENVWNELQKVFPDVNNGSRVIITTRFLNVAKIADPTTEPHELRSLNEKESWELFLRKVFPRQDIETCCPIDLVDSARELVKRCGGLPLALVVLGGLMSTKPISKDVWEKVVESMKWQFVEGGEKCLEILALSYNDLPYYLKSCFLYFGCFQEDMDIPAETLIRLWSAEGFLPTKTSKTTEEIGMDCLVELAQRCMIQITERTYDDSASYCRIHDVLRDMCILESKENKFLEIYKSDTVECATTPNAARRLIIFNEIETLNYSNSKLRGIFPCGSSNNYSRMDFKALKVQLSGFKLLRVLCLQCKGMQGFPTEIKSLVHLRYFELHAWGIKEVPSWISHLHNLQTFIITGSNLKKISDSLWRIDSLRHVVVPQALLVPPPNMGNNIVLKNLQTLKWVKAGTWIGNMLPKLTNLIKLKIKEVSDDHANALSSSLQKLGRLASLTIWGYEIPSDNIITAFSNQRRLKQLSLYGNLNCKQLPHNDVFPQRLVKLVLSNSELKQDPMATLEKLQFLKYLVLCASYEGKQMICSTTGFPQLLFLNIKHCDRLEEWKIEENSMPCLKSLWLQSCRSLKMIPEGLKNVPLDEFLLVRMSKELRIRMKENTGEDWYKIQHVPNISII